jgi:ribonucleoside-diphosphate reductase alpha chain
LKEVDQTAPDTQRGGPSGSSAAQAVELASKARPKALEGRTYKIKWPGLAAAIYLTINHDDIGDIQEIFISSKNSQYAEWATALSVILSKLLKLSRDPIMVANELMQINLSTRSSWNEGKFYGSIIAQIGAHLREHAEEFSDMAEMANYKTEQFVVATIVSQTKFETRHTVETDGDPVVIGTSHQCTACGGFNVQMKEGCRTCDDCGQSDCN